MTALFRCLLLCCLVAGCATSVPPPPPLPPPDPAALCLADLDRRHMLYQRVEDWQTPEGCGVLWAVRVNGSATQWNRPLLMSCQLAGRINDFETMAVQPLAQSLLNQPVRKMFNAGSYDCRGVRGNHSERLSQHALGRAIDLTGFELADGTVVSVRRDWPGKGPKAVFLRQLAKAACGIFNVVITPDGNALHRDHFHLDIGPYKACGNGKVD